MFHLFTLHLQFVAGCSSRLLVLPQWLWVVVHHSGVVDGCVVHHSGVVDSCVDSMMISQQQLRIISPLHLSGRLGATVEVGDVELRSCRQLGTPSDQQQFRLLFFTPTAFQDTIAATPLW